MKRNLLLITSLFSTAFLNAQITITDNDMVGAGDTVRVSFAATTNNVDHTLTGTNYLWDFSTLVPTAQQLLEYDAPVAIPFNFLASVQVVNPSPDSIPFIGAIPADFTDYFKNSSSSYRQIGLSFTYAPLGNFSVPVIYSSSDYIYRFPLDYGDSDSSDAAYSFSIPNTLAFGQTIHRVNYVDGWGTLVTPFGTFQTLRVKSIVDRVDTIGIDSVNGFTTARPQEIEYKWLATNKMIPVLEVDAQILFNNEVVTNVVYQDSIRDSVFFIGVNEPVRPLALHQVFPNPATNSTTLLYTLNSADAVTITITDITGSIVSDPIKEQKPAGTSTTTLNTADLAAGTYFIMVKTTDSVQFIPLIISR
jgi:hypothetical protein